MAERRRDTGTRTMRAAWPSTRMVHRGKPTGNTMVSALAAALAVGAAAAYFLDPARGRRRRASAKDRLTHAVHVTGDALDATARDVRNRLAGSAASVRSHLSHDDPSDEVRGPRSRRDDVGRTGIWPVSGPLPPGEAPLVDQGDLGHALVDRPAPETVAAVFIIDPVCGTSVEIRLAERCEYNGQSYYFHSVECRQQFDATPERFTMALDRRRSA